ncbi:poly(A) polymerase gamma-like, partial [Copidosoma floridanum]|uniref:poly(A) polymerase gamma-like n=1 Tax=Copidosoma floridanum TaxID=29053 RepID=UPI000C6F6FCE
VNVGDRYHVMPIIAPAYPQQNSTFNVSLSTRTIMQEAFEAGQVVTEEIVMGKATWDKLFEPPNFFGKYKHYIVLFASSSSSEDQLEWCGLIEAKIRHLIGTLERNPHITLAHINPEAFPPLHSEPDKFVSMWFIGLTFKKGEHLNIDLTYEIKSFVDMTERQIKVFKHGMTIEARHVKKKDLANYISSSLIKRERKTSSGNQRNVNVIRRNKQFHNEVSNRKNLIPTTTSMKIIGLKMFRKMNFRVSMK